MKILAIDALLKDLLDLRETMGLEHDVWNTPTFDNDPALLNSFSPDAIVLFMRNLNPIHPTMIRSIRETRKCPILALTPPDTRPNRIHQAFVWGVDSFLTFPCDMLRVKRHLLSLHEATRLNNPVTDYGNPPDTKRREKHSVWNAGPVHLGASESPSHSR